MKHQYALAPLRNQILARLFDLVIFFLFTGLVFLLLWKTKFYYQYIWIFTNFSALLLVFLLFVLPLTFASGQTLGNKIFQIRTVFNQFISWKKKLLFFSFREFFLIFAPILFIWIFFYLYLLFVQIFNLDKINSSLFFARLSFFYLFWWVAVFIFIRINPSQQLFYDRWYDVLNVDLKAQLINYSSLLQKKSSPLGFSKSKIKGHFIQLNNHQREAVILPINQNALLLAGPGTGKTSVLIEKIIYLLEKKAISLDRILTLTFSRQACRSIKAKIAKIQDFDDLSSPSLFTYHGFCYFFLCQEALMQTKITILDQKDQKQILQKILNTAFSSYSYLDFDKDAIQEFAKIINALQNNLVFDYQKFLHFKDKNSFIFDWNHQHNQFIWELYQEYLFFKKQEKFYDFVDLLSETYLFLKNNPLVLTKWRKKYDYVFADEFQDTNFLQYKILSLLTNKGKAIPLSVVGDPDQTIYAWRGADINLILNFAQDFHKVKTIKLLNNYRSQTKIVNLANRLIKYNKQRIPKEVISTKKTGDNIIFYFDNSKFNQAQFLVKKIEYLQKKQVKLKDIVVLYRVNYLAGVLESAFLKANIPYVVIKGQEFFKRREIKDMLMLLTVINDPENRLFLENILTWIPYVGPKAVAKIILLAKQEQKTLFNYILTTSDQPLPCRNSEQIQELVKHLHQLHLQLPTIKSLKILLHLLFENCYQTFLRGKIDYQTRFKNITVLINDVASHFSNEHNHFSLAEQIQEFLVQTQISVLNEWDNNEKVKFMTIHNAKGLEFEYVLLFQISGDNFPNMKRDVINIEEERRLFFVALTRAKKNIFLTTYPDNRSIFVIETASAKEVTTINDR